MVANTREGAHARLESDGFWLLFKCGLAAGGLLGTWFVLAPAWLGSGAWWPVDVHELLANFKFEAGAIGIIDDKARALYWIVAGIVGIGGFTACWKALRSDEVRLQLRILLQERRVEHGEHAAQADALWQAFEEVEMEDDPARELALLEEYSEVAAMASLTDDVREDRVARCLQVAKGLEVERPQLALRVLQLAAKLRRTGKARRPSIVPILARDFGGYVLGAGALLVGVPLASLAVLTVVALVMWAVQMIIAVLILIAVIGALASR